MDSKSLLTIEFDRVLAKVADLTSFSAGREWTAAIHPTTDLEEARRWQAQTQEARILLDGATRVTIGGARDVRVPADQATRGRTIAAESFLDIKNTLIASRNLKRALLKAPEKHPELAAIADLIEDCPGLVSDISLTIDDRGEVLDSASPELGRIRQKLRTVHGRIQEKLHSIVNGSGRQYLQEPIISLRGDRYVIPLRSEYKGRIKGIIHDTSSSGATLWIEPTSTIDLNNDYRTLHIEEQQEIKRILTALTATVAQFTPEIIRVVERMAELDAIFARARYASQIDAVAPIFVEWRNEPHPHPGSTIWIRGARHPLLDKGDVVPTDFLVETDIFTVLITGPNTGGKTVALKNIGLMVAMAQSGLPLPANEARLSVYNNIFADIGDEQSIEQSLSTFSAHITNITRILSQIDGRTLVVLDELGSGTDPSEGAAIAQAIINYMRDKGATSFVATHYPELKVYASRTPGAINASMLFDVDTLSPTYAMAIGIPGKSNALAIARRLGLDRTILDEAMGLLGSDNEEQKALIESIHDLRGRIETEEARTRLARKAVEKERDELQLKIAGLEYERSQILDEVRLEAEIELEEVRTELRKVRRQIADAGTRNQLKKMGKQIAAIDDKRLQALPDLAQTDKQTKRRRKKRLKVGDSVTVRTLNTKGIIEAIKGGEAEVNIGRLRMRVRLDNLEFHERPQAPSDDHALPKAPITNRVKMELDLRGMRVEEGLEALDSYLDAAALSGLPFSRIIHGKGTGRMRQAVRKVVAKHHAIASWEAGKQGEGDEGVTVLKFKE